MAITNHERVGKAMDLLRDGLGPFVEREMRARAGDGWAGKVEQIVGQTRLGAGKGKPLDDVAVLLVVMDRSWGDVFRWVLGKTDRSLVNELLAVRNAWAHQEPFSGDDTYRALDTAERLLNSVSAPQAGDVGKLREELQRVRNEEWMRTEKRKSAGSVIESQATGNLKPWREVITPHKDVASGRYQQAEFAADLWQVYLGEGTDEYRRPAEFFRRTFLTESLKRLLVGAVQRLSGGGGDPVVQLQTNFGGGKTHSMLALYHLVSGTPAGDLAGVDAVLAESGVKTLPKAKRVVLVGNKISPGNPAKKDDGTIVRTLWGELAWQLGGKKAFKRIQADDEKATSPGDALRDLFKEYGPCLVLIDEWVAYARQLHDQSDLPGGGFETQFTFAQVLTESAKLAKNCLLVISLPASDTSGSPHAQADDVEVGGQRGREALDRLRNVVGRVEASWRPASAEEGFEIVRRRLFEPLVDKAQYVARDTVAREFYDLYRTQHQEFPPECCDADYETRLKAAYPIHPEVFDRLYSDWSTLVRFQRTRGVLRLMAAVIHSLWEKGDRNPLIMPSNIPIDDPRVRSELTRYLSDNWVPVIEKDVDGPASLPLRLDGEVPNLGKFAACRRVARTIYMGSAPTPDAANRGLEDRRVKLGCVVPGESPAVFGDALRRLASAATYLYQDGTRCWYSTQPTVTKLADDRAEQLKREPDRVVAEIDKRLRTDLRKTGDFCGVHPLPKSGHDVPDDVGVRLVVLGVDHPYSKEPNSAAETAAKAILESRGSGPRLYRNTVVFLAVDKTRLQDLDEGVRRFLAWERIVNESKSLNLTEHQKKQAGTQLAAADTTVTARLPEAYQWLLVPKQESPQAALGWQAVKVGGQEMLAVRASKRLKLEELLVTNLGPARLRHELDRIPLWRGDHVEVKQLAQDFSQYVYLPRVRHPEVLVQAIRSGLELPSWEKDSFAYAESYDEAARRYRGLHVGRPIDIGDAESVGLFVRAEAAKRQLDAEKGRARTGEHRAIEAQASGRDSKGVEPAPRPKAPRRFHGTVTLDPARIGRDAGRIGEEVVAHLAGLVGARVSVTLEIDAEIPDGVPESTVRTVVENSRTLKFTSHGFEED
ncbi:MAG: ATP-binding protein [Deltaproteobacteria bacterium]|nr:ATP-binding protein [Deltaproteobacteria bacterium]